MLTGQHTHICVRDAAYGAFERGYADHRASRRCVHLRGRRRRRGPGLPEVRVRGAHHDGGRAGSEAGATQDEELDRAAAQPPEKPGMGARGRLDRGGPSAPIPPAPAVRPAFGFGPDEGIAGSSPLADAVAALHVNGASGAVHLGRAVGLLDLRLAHGTALDGLRAAGLHRAPCAGAVRFVRLRLTVTDRFAPPPAGVPCVPALVALMPPGMTALLPAELAAGGMPFLTCWPDVATALLTPMAPTPTTRAPAAAMAAILRFIGLIPSSSCSCRVVVLWSQI